MGSSNSAAPRIIGSVLVSFRNGKSAEHLRWIFFVTFYAVLANGPFWAASHWLGLLPLGWCCLEYAAVGLLALFVPRILAAFLLFLVIAADLTSAVCKTYYISPTACLANVGSLREFSGNRLLAVTALTILILLATSIAAFFPVVPIRGSYRRCAAACLMVFAAMAMSVDCVSVIRDTAGLPNPFRLSRQDDARKLSEFSDVWIARYPIIRLVRNEIFYARIRNSASATRANSFLVPSATTLAVRSMGLADGKGSSEMPNLVLVLVESWGLDTGLSLNSALTQPYFQPGLRSRYEVLQGSVPFDGSTVNGEGRELCGSTIGFHLLIASSRELQGCLPDRLSDLGYNSLALHGMEGQMFDRSSWYRSIGFQQQWFRDRFRQQGLPDCVGAFAGTCDAAVAAWIGQRLQRKDTHPSFVYWVTLNSHLPVPVPSPLLARASCSLTPQLTQSPALCSWYQLVFNVHQAVSRLAMTNLARPTVFVIVGDHAPPFSNPALRSQFSSDDVPYVLLVPRGGTRFATQIAGATDLTLKPGAERGRDLGAPSHACRIQYGDGVVHSAPAVCPRYI